jgi:hypothetical protein
MPKDMDDDRRLPSGWWILPVVAIDIVVIFLELLWCTS